MKKEYIKAFKAYSGAKETEFEYLAKDWGTYFKWKDKTYIARSYDDLYKSFKDAFDRESYDELSLMATPALWQLMIDEQLEPEFDDFMLAFYRQWRVYWNNQKDKIKGGAARYERFRQEAWEDMQMLIPIVNGSLHKVIEIGENLGENFTAIAAMAIKELYEDEDDFLTDVIHTLFEYGNDLVTYGEVFETVEVETSGEPLMFCIYEDMLEFEDLKKDALLQ